ncbi:unnamed protein product [Mycena citricolor]|uniref:Uncharacterized protein n=1 Tax=Mycena citricolor TaxID=2018698 RepID=A0AAD2GUW5_9AGAR|nr:unnamed protein product [Mycena citricolor]
MRGELRHEWRWKVAIESVLEDRPGDGNSPSLEEGSNEGKQGQGWTCTTWRERCENGEHRGGELCYSQPNSNHNLKSDPGSDG